MIDRYQPGLSSFSLTRKEEDIINEALTQKDPWNWKPGGKENLILDGVKNKIRKHHLSRHRDSCCYCRTNLHGAGPFMRDGEHVLPKHHPVFKAYSFTIWNLAVACKRCNIQYKGKKFDFVLEIDPARFTISENYLIIHPSFDLYREHISYLMHHSEDGTLVVYKIKEGSKKGEYTYEFFNLRELEVDSFNEVQGAYVAVAEGELALETRSLASKMGQ